MDLLYFILFVSALIFIHELGHFSCAKFFGVKVLTFSIGFGPKIIRIRGKETEYCIGLLPLGGFVKMLEEGKGEEILPEDRRRTFEAQALWKRVVIVLAGPAMNVLFPILLYTSVFLDDREFLPPDIGVVLPDRPADGRLFAGDVILAIDGTTVTSFPEVQKIISRRANKPLTMLVERDGKQLSIDVTPSEEIERLEPRELEMTERVGRIGIVPTFPAPVVGIDNTQSPAYRAGLRTFDRVTSINGRKIERFVDLVRALSQNRGDTVVVTFMRPVPGRVLGGLADVAVIEPGVATLAPMPRDPDAARAEDQPSRERDVLERTGIESADLYVAFVPEGSSEWLAGLRQGDRVRSLDEQPVRNWKVMETELLRTPGKLRTLGWSRGGEARRGQLSLRQEQWADDFGQHYERYVFRTTHWLPSAPDKRVKNPSLYTYALRRGLEETKNTVGFIVVTILRLFQGKVSISQVSGPITLYDVAGQAGAKGATYFVWAMAITSVNLGLVNLLPIPVLDGGHLMLFLLEAIRRRPVSLRTREIASLFGVLLLGLLMAIALKNDVTRKWDVIKSQVQEITG